MSTPYVTIGGQEVKLTPGGTLLNRKPSTGTPAPRRMAAALRQGRQVTDQPNYVAPIVGLLAAVGLLIILVVWLSQQRRR